MTNILEKDVAEVLIDQESLAKRVEEMGAEISADYEDIELMLVAVLKGSVVFLSDLMRHITVPHVIDFMATSSYGRVTESTGVVKILKDLDMPVTGKHVLIVEDIIDTGITLSYLMRMLRERNPASLRVATLLDKRERRKVPVVVDYVGFEIPNKFVVGYGLDFGEIYRNLPYVGVLKPEIYASGMLE